jgi:hypothetical protein
MAFWLEAVFGIPYGARDKVRQLGQQVEWVAASTRDNRHAFLTKTKRRKKGRLRQPRAEGEQQARGGLIKRFFSKQEWNLVQRIGSEQVEHGRPLERFQASSAHDAARGAAARCFKGW